MNDAIKARAGIVYNVVEATILAVTVGLTTWTSKTVIDHSSAIAVQHATSMRVEQRVDRIENKGSASLETFAKETAAHESSFNNRIEKLESAVIALQAAPGELKAISARLESLKEGQTRIENALETHMKEGYRP